MDIIIRNGKLVTPLQQKDACIVIRDGKILEITDFVEERKNAQVYDAQGRYVIPGLIDLHVHGGGGFTLMTGSAEDVKKMCRAHLADGTTTILPTTLAAPEETLKNAVQAVRDAAREYTESTIAGVHLEGPFLSPAQAGAQAPGVLRKPDVRQTQALLSIWENGVKIMGIAPELPGALELGDYLSERGVVVSCAHTDAEFSQIRAAAEHGYSDVTHLYSGCSMMKRVRGYRVPGVVEAGLLLADMTVQFIGDLKHLPPELIQLIYRMKGADKAYLITDGLEFSASTLEEGTSYVQQNGMETVYEDGVMKLPDRQAFAGSVATMRSMVKNLVDKCGISLQDAVRMASLTPAQRIGLKNKGRLAEGYDADIVILNNDLTTHQVFSQGRAVLE